MSPRAYLPLLASAGLALMAGSASAASPSAKTVYRERARTVEAFYRDLHAHPELSGQEVQTAKKLANELRSLGYSVTENVGGTGVVAVLTNGDGPVAWIRADMDGLPVEEGTGLGYGSKIDGVMHACGHDVHVAAMTGYAHALRELREQWRGTVVLIGQPAEETAAGAKAMIDDGLFRRFPKPDYVLAFHVKSSLTAGKVAYKEGYTHASIDSVDIEVHGKGGHGAAPHRTVDPIILASKLVVSAQTLISRTVDPMQPVVLSFGSVHGGLETGVGFGYPALYPTGGGTRVGLHRLFGGR